MKNLKFLTVFAFILMGSMTLSAQDFGVISIEEVFKNLPEKLEADKTLDNLAERHQTEIQKRQQTLTAIENEVAAKVEGKTDAQIQAMMPELQAKQTDYMTKQEELVNYQKAAVQELGEREAALLTPIEAKVKKSIDKVAAAKGLKYVMEKSMLVYSNGIDITEDVKKDLGVK